MLISISTRKSVKRERISRMTESFSKSLGLEPFEGAIRILTTSAIKIDGLAATSFLPEHNVVVIVVDSKIRDPHIMGLALAHEFVHAKQFLDGRLQEVDGKHVWLGEETGHYSYDEQPWEIEAYDKMFSLVETFYKEMVL